MSLSSDKIIEGLLTGHTEEIKEEIKDLLAEVMDMIDAISPEIKKMATGMLLGMTDIKIAQIEKLKGAGFSHDEAILMVQDEWYAMQRALRSSKTK